MRFDSPSGEGLTNAYDGFGRLITSALTMDGATRSLSYQWDKNGNRLELSWPDGQKASYAHDGLDRMTTLYEGALGSTTNMVGYAYNNRGLRATQTGRYGQYAGFTYDTVGRLYALAYNFSGTAGDVQFTYGYSAASQMISQTRVEDNNAYAWNGHSNVDRSYVANGINQYTSVGSHPYSYDANGNLTSDGTTSYSYDVENRLVGASGVVLRYDPLGRLYETESGGSTTRFLYDGDELAAEYDAAGTLLGRYMHGKNIDDPVVWYEGSGLATPRWLHTDHLGSIIAVTDSSGAVVAKNAYDEFGIPMTSVAGKRLQGRFGYTGQAWIPEIGLWHYKARFYSPTLERFLQTDPVGYGDQVNLYAYTGSDPINRTDPTGLADLNLFNLIEDPAWSKVADQFDPQKTGSDQVFIVMGHANSSGIWDDRNGKSDRPMEDADLIKEMRKAGYQRGDTVLMTGCNCGEQGARVADTTGSQVIAPDGYVTPVTQKDGTITLYSFSELGRKGIQGGWWAIDATGRRSWRGQSANYNPVTKEVYFRWQDQIGPMVKARPKTK